MLSNAMLSGDLSRDVAEDATLEQLGVMQAYRCGGVIPSGLGVFEFIERGNE